MMLGRVLRHAPRGFAGWGPVIFRLLRLVGLGSMLLASGCAYYAESPDNRLYLNGKYSEEVKDLEMQHPDGRATTPEFAIWCDAYFKLKDYRKLFPCLDHFQANIDRGDYMNILFDMSANPHFIRSEAYSDLGDYDAATAEADTAYKLVVDRDLARATRLEVLCAATLAYALKGERPKAKKYVDELDDLGTNYPFNLLTDQKQTCLSRAYVALGDYQKALDAAPTSGSAITPLIDVVTGAAMTGETIFRYMEMPATFIRVKCQYETGHVAEAKRGYLELLAQPEIRDSGDIYWATLSDLGRIAESEGRPDDAIRYFKRAVAVIEQQRSTINTMASRIGFVGDKQLVYGHLVRVLLATHQDALAFQYVERSKSRALVDVLASRTQFATDTASSQQVASILSEVQQLEAQQTAEDPDMYAQRQIRSTRVTALKDELRRMAPELAALVTVTAYSSADIQAMLPADTTLLEYYQSGSDLDAFVLSKTTLVTAKLDGTNLVEAVTQLRDTVEDPRTQNYQDILAAAYRRLIQPVEAHLKTQRLIIVPHGVLHYVPFNALGEGRSMVIDRWTVSYLPSASVMKYIPTPRAVGQADLLAIGNPDLGEPRLALKYAQREAEEVGQAFPKSTVLIGRQATKSEFIRIAPAYRYLHLATHGLFNPQSPLQSGIFLAGPSLQKGELTVGDIYDLHLNAELVTLSACETGLGKVNFGDDVVGLTESFLYAGARSIVASLWPVDDQATLDLMLAFYQNLKTKSVDEALRAAQLATREKYEHPAYWSPFQLTGATHQ